jgi:hypothetical protein
MPPVVAGAASVVVTTDSLAYVSDQANPRPGNGAGCHPAETADPLRAGLRAAPPPLEADTFTLVLAGMALWALGFLALLPVRHGHGLWLQTCAVGFGLGIIGLVLSRNRRYRKGKPR